MVHLFGGRNDQCCLGVTAQSVFEEFSKHRVSERNVFLFLDECADAATKRRQTQVNFDTFFQSLASCTSLVHALATSQVDEVETTSLRRAILVLLSVF